MSNVSVTYQVFNSLVAALKSLGAKVYLDRPMTVPSKMDKFIVIDLPTQIRRTTKGYDDYRYRTTGVIYAFVRSNSDGTPRIDEQTSFVRSITDLFPISDDIIEAVDPSLLLRGRDESNFQVTTITFTLRTRPNAFENLS